MAGIGFKLRRLTEEESVKGMIVGYGSAALVCAGPWLLTIMALLEIHVLQILTVRGRVDESANLFFNSVVTYSFAFSLVLTGGLQNMVTRYLSDRLYQDSDAYHLPAFISTMAVLNPVALAVSWLLFGSLPVDVLTRVVSMTLFVILCDTWIVMIFLGAVRAYWQIVWAYAQGCVLTAVLGLLLAHRHQTGLLAAFTLGQGAVFFSMLRLLAREFRLDERPWDFGFLAYARRYPYLMLTGTTFYLAVWWGVFYYWFTPHAVISFGLRSYPLHDISYFWGLLATIPAMTLFFVRIETEFYDAYRAFYGGITEGRVRYVDLAQRKAEMREVLRRGGADLIQLQGVVTLSVFFFIPHIVSIFSLPGLWIAALRVGLLGAFALCLCQFTIMILYYYELYREAFVTCLILLVGNALTDMFTYSWSPELHGCGLLYGSGLGLAYAVHQLFLRLHNLEYYTFMFQPMPGTIVCTNAEEAFGKTVRRDGKWVVPVA